MAIITKEHIKLAKLAEACEYELSKASTRVGQELTNPLWACWYASNVVRGSLKEVEKVIAKDSGCSYVYARFVIKKRFKKGEKAIAEDNYFAYQYAFHVVKRRWKEGEEAIYRNHLWGKLYSQHLANLGSK